MRFTGSKRRSSMRTPMIHMLKAQNSPSTPAGESRRTWRAYRPRQLAREGGGPAAARVARLREYHVCDQHAEARAGTRSLHRVVPFPPHRDSRVFVGSLKSWVRKVLVNFLECPGGGPRAGVASEAPCSLPRLRRTRVIRETGRAYGASVQLLVLLFGPGPLGPRSPRGRIFSSFALPAELATLDSARPDALLGSPSFGSSIEPQ